MRRRCNRRKNGIGLIAILAGVVILMAMILPTSFWWFILAVLLISVGIWFNRCR